jgi:hypothetical protein
MSAAEPAGDRVADETVWSSRLVSSLSGVSLILPIICQGLLLMARHPDSSRMVRLRPRQDGLLGSILYHDLVCFIFLISEQS